MGHTGIRVIKVLETQGETKESPPQHTGDMPLRQHSMRCMCSCEAVGSMVCSCRTEVVSFEFDRARPDQRIATMPLVLQVACHAIGVAKSQTACCMYACTVCEVRIVQGAKGIIALGIIALGIIALLCWTLRPQVQVVPACASATPVCVHFVLCCMVCVACCVRFCPAMHVIRCMPMPSLCMAVALVR